MKQKLILIMFLMGFLSCLKLSAQAPTITSPILLWSNPDGTNGGCMQQSGGNTPVCTTTICLGEAICFSYDVQMSPPANYAIYSLNHR
jgi:hypothetical protein